MFAKLISGGQTGVDRGALDAALASGFPCGGWCPRGRRAEDGAIPDRYPVTEMTSANYLARTRRNVAESDATLILANGPLGGGTRATATHARKIGRPCLIVDLDDAESAETALRIVEWIEQSGIDILNVAGPRESAHPGIEERACRLVTVVLDRLSSPISSSSPS